MRSKANDVWNIDRVGIRPDSEKLQLAFTECETDFTSRPRIVSANIRSALADSDKRSARVGTRRLSQAEQDRVARRLGFKSFDHLLQASYAIALSPGAIWWLTRDRFDGWATWSCCLIDASAEGDGHE